MPGFIVSKSIKVAPSQEKECLFNSISHKNYYIEHRTTRKFSNDKFLHENKNFIYLLDGVVFNNHQLMEKYQCDDWKSCVVEMHRRNSATFYNEFRGSFVGFVYDKNEDKWIFYTDHVGDKQVFYTKVNDNEWFVATEMSYMSDTMHLNHLSMTPNRDAAYMVITLGYTIENNTLVNEITKVVAGHYLLIQNGKIEEKEYHRFSNIPFERSKEEFIEEIDKRFRNAVRLQFEKDKEYGYKHLACLSGGLDSRMTVWVAHELGYKNQLNTTFCQSNYIDFNVAQQIATDLRHEFMFKALDGGNCIYNIDLVSKYSYGMACFFGLCHSNSMFNKINLDDYGIIHSGMVGDVVLGSYLESPQYVDHKIADGAYSIEIINRLNNYEYRYDYENSELYMMYNRGFGFCGQGIMGYGHTITETFSPFYDVEFFEFCFSIPLQWRCGHKIYFEWILSKYPKAAEYVWETIGKKITDVEPYKSRQVKRYMIKLFGKQRPIIGDPYFGEYWKAFVLRWLFRYKNKKADSSVLSKNDMNPVKYWYYTNPELKEFMDNYWQTNKNIIHDNQLLEDMRYLYEDCNDNIYDKLQPLTVLAAYKLFWP